MDDFTSILAQLPPGEDVYDFLGKTVDDLVRGSAAAKRGGQRADEAFLNGMIAQLYPDLGRSFYVQAYVLVQETILSRPRHCGRLVATMHAHVILM